MPVLGTSFLVLALLFAHGIATVQSQRAVVQTTLQDFAAFVAERLAMELDQAFIAVLLDRVALARGAHNQWQAAPEAPSSRPETDDHLPDAMVPVYFSLDDTLVVHGRPTDADTRRWIEEAVRAHLPVYPRPAPYVVLRSDDPLAVVYRREEAYGAESVYGFLLALDVPVRLYSDLLRRADLLPRSLEHRADGAQLFEIGIHLSPGDPPLHERTLDHPVQGPEAWAFAAKAGRLAVRARIDAERTEPLLGGSTLAASIPLFTTLAILTGGLIYVALRLSRRAASLAALRESFVANVSHDLRTPLTQIRMFADTLRLGRLSEPADRDRALRVIQRQAEILQGLVDDLLLASGSRPELEAVPTDVAALARDVVEALAPSADERGAEIRLEHTRSRDAVVDPVVVTRILTNLVDNAIRHGRPGGRVVVRVDAGSDGAGAPYRARLTVEDDGPGIPPERRAQAMARAREGNGPSAEPGVGLGLRVVTDLARRHGGSVRIETGAEKGARVVVDLRAP